MIENLDRSGYFGASDTKYVMAKNRSTKTWKQWWDVKLGLMEHEQWDSVYTRAGNLYEHAILTAINEDIETDGQIIHTKYPIRVNYDGWLDGTIYEVKTHKAENEFKLSQYYIWQCQVEMYVYQEMCDQYFLPPFKGLHLVSYGLNPDEYEVDEPEVDPNRIVYHPIEYDKAFIKGEYIPRIKELTRALKKGKCPA